MMPAFTFFVPYHLQLRVYQGCGTVIRVTVLLANLGDAHLLADVILRASGELDAEPLRRCLNDLQFRPDFLLFLEPFAHHLENVLRRYAFKAAFPVIGAVLYPRLFDYFQCLLLAQRIHELSGKVDGQLELLSHQL